MRNNADKSSDWVNVIGPIDNAPGKKTNYKVRPMKRGIAESKSAKRLGISIVEEGFDISGKVEVINEVVQTRGPGRKSAAEKENETLKAKLAELEAKLAEQTKSVKDADQA